MSVRSLCSNLSLNNCVADGELSGDLVLECNAPRSGSAGALILRVSSSSAHKISPPSTELLDSLSVSLLLKKYDGLCKTNKEPVSAVLCLLSGISSLKDDLKESTEEELEGDPLILHVSSSSAEENSLSSHELLDSLSDSSLWKNCDGIDCENDPHGPVKAVSYLLRGTPSLEDDLKESAEEEL